MSKPLCLIVQALESERVDIDCQQFDVKYLFTGFGKVSASIGLTESLLNEKPDFIINIGTAGSFMHEVGHIVVCNRFIDRDIMELKSLGGHYEMDSLKWIHYFDRYFNFSDYGICSTGDRFVTTPQGNQDVYDMEAFAYSRVALLFDIPFISVKYVTDKIGENSVKIWADKLSDARRELTTFMADAMKQPV